MTSATAVYPLLSAGNPGITNLMIEDCTFRPSGPDAAGRGINGIVGWNFTLIRCNIYHVNDGVGVAPPSGQQTANVHLEGTWIHDAIMTNIPAGDTKRWDGMLHPDCIDWDGGQGLTATGCRFNARPNGNIGVAQTPPIWEYDNEGNIKKYNGNDVVLTGNPYYNESQRLWGSSILMCADMQQYVGIPEFRKCWFEGGGGAGLNLSAAAGTSFTASSRPMALRWPSTSGCAMRTTALWAKPGRYSTAATRQSQSCFSAMSAISSPAPKSSSRPGWRRIRRSSSRALG